MLLQLDLLGFTAGSYAAWLYKSSRILMRTEKEQQIFNTLIFFCKIHSQYLLLSFLYLIFCICQRVGSFVLPHCISAPEKDIPMLKYQICTHKFLIHIYLMAEFKWCYLL